MIYAWTQMFHTTPDYILYGISFKNLLLYNSARPTYHLDKEKNQSPGERKWNPALDANTPDNFKDSKDIEEE